MKPIPVLYERKQDCCWCTACYAICPKSAITIQEDEEGFKYPIIESNKCIRCYMCMKVCPIKEAKIHNNCILSSLNPIKKLQKSLFSSIKRDCIV